jgi:hypothetical protein
MSVRSIVIVLGNISCNFRLMWWLPWLPCHQGFADSSSPQMQVKSLEQLTDCLAVGQSLHTS